MHGGCYNRFEFPLNNLSNLLTRCLGYCLCTHAREDTPLSTRAARAPRAGDTRFYKFIA